MTVLRRKIKSIISWHDLLTVVDCIQARRGSTVTDSIKDHHHHSTAPATSPLAPATSQRQLHHPSASYIPSARHIPLSAHYIASARNIPLSARYIQKKSNERSLTADRGRPWSPAWTWISRPARWPPPSEEISSCFRWLDLIPSLIFFNYWLTRRQYPVLQLIFPQSGDCVRDFAPRHRPSRQKYTDGVVSW